MCCYLKAVFCVFIFQNIQRPCPVCCCSCAEKSTSGKNKHGTGFYYFGCCNTSVCVSSQAKWRNGEDDLESPLSPRGPVHHQHSQTLGMQIRRDPGRAHQSPADQKQQPASQETKVRKKGCEKRRPMDERGVGFSSGRWRFSPVSVFVFSLRSSSSKLAQLTLEQILEHMDNLRLSLSNTKNNCKSTKTLHKITTLMIFLFESATVVLSLAVFSQTPILQALQHVQASCDEAHKMRCRMYKHIRKHVLLMYLIHSLIIRMFLTCVCVMFLLMEDIY